MPDITRVTSQSWFSRLGNAMSGIVIGALLFMAAFPLLGFNEYRSVRALTGLADARRHVVTTESRPINETLDGQLVHVSGELETDEVLTDPQFGIQALAIKLDRQVEMYQWQEESKTETRNKLGGGTERVTTYSYKKVWSQSPIDSRRFESADTMHNPTEWPFQPREVVAQHVTVGDYEVSRELLSQYRVFEPIAITRDDLAKVPPETRTADVATSAAAKPAADETAETYSLAPETPRPGVPPTAPAGDPNQVARDTTPASASPAAGGRMQVSEGGFYWGADPLSPQVGDMRIKFSKAPNGPVSIVARQAGRTFAPWSSGNGYRVNILRAGLLTGDEVIAAREGEENFLTWALRVVGYLMLAFGLSMIFRPLVVLADVVPFLGRLVGAGVGLFAMLLAAVFWLITVALAWIAVRPLLGGALLAAAAVAMTLLFVVGKHRPVAPPPPAGAA